MENDRNDYIIDIHKMSENFFNTYLYDMPRWAQSIFDCVMEDGNECDMIDCIAFFNKMYQLTGIAAYSQLMENYAERKH